MSKEDFIEIWKEIACKFVVYEEVYGYPATTKGQPTGQPIGQPNGNPWLTDGLTLGLTAGQTPVQPIGSRLVNTQAGLVIGDRKVNIR